MKRILLGIAAVGALAATAAPASAHYEIKECYATFIYPCNVCVYEGPVNKCARG